MNEEIFNLPETVALILPTTYVKNFKQGPIRISGTKLPAPRRLAIRWDDEQIEFVSPDGAVSYQRWGVIGFRVLRHDKLHRMALSTLRVEMRDAPQEPSRGFMLVLCAYDTNIDEFLAFIAAIASTSVPLNLHLRA